MTLRNFAFSLTEDTFEEDNVLDWILEMHHGNTMKNVSRQSLMSMVENYDYLAVVFCKEMLRNFPPPPPYIM